MVACSIAVAVAEDPIAKTIGGEFEWALQQAGLSKKLAALEMGITEGNLGDMIRGEKPIHLHRIVKLGVAYPSFLWHFMPCVFDRRLA